MGGVKEAKSGKQRRLVGKGFKDRNSQEADTEKRRRVGPEIGGKKRYEIRQPAKGKPWPENEGVRS